MSAPLPAGARPHDRAFLRAAIDLGRWGAGTTAPNPSVGCLLVDEAGPAPRLVARGRTGRGGRPHGEVAALTALAARGGQTKGLTAYVSLEPCDHRGETGPCSEALIEAGIARVVVPLADPDPRVAGAGIARLRAAGIDVVEGLEAARAEAAHLGFLTRVRGGRPAVTLKLATSLDGKITSASGESRWITGPAARQFGHLLRAHHDAILVGRVTAGADDPALTCRLAGMADRSPRRIVADSRLSLPPSLQLFSGEGPQTSVLYAEGTPPKALTARAVQFEKLPAGAGGIDLACAVQRLGALGVNDLMVEGGGRLAGALLEGGLVDRLIWIRAPVVLGEGARPAVFLPGPARLADAPRFHRLGIRRLQDDIVETYACERTEKER